MTNLGEQIPNAVENAPVNDENAPGNDNQHPVAGASTTDNATAGAHASSIDSNQIMAMLQMQMQQQQSQLEQMRLAQEHMFKVSMDNQTLKKQLEEASRPVSSPGTKRPERPTIEADQTDNEWSLFLDSWSRYKTMSHLKDDMEGPLRNELREACSHEVNRMLFELYGPVELNSMSEAKLMDYIKKVAVNGSFREVHRQTFFRIS